MLWFGAIVKKTGPFYIDKLSLYLDAVFFLCYIEVEKVKCNVVKLNVLKLTLALHLANNNISELLLSVAFSYIS